MAAVLPDRRANTRPAQDWSKRMSNNIAAALLVYTMTIIFAVSGAIETEGMSILPYFVLAILVAVIIPACRKFEKRWERLCASGELSQSGLATRFRVDQLKLWVLAIALPFLWIGLFRLISLIF